MFSIITPTFKRPDEIQHAIASVQSQTITDWEMIIINDNPGDGTLQRITTLPDPRIHILENDTNRGVNYSRNRGLDSIAKESNWVIFLDDDDTLAPNALEQLTSIIATNSTPWIVTARGTDQNSPTTVASKQKRYYSYVWDYLIFRRFKGDATHCISTTFLVRDNHTLRFPLHIKQAEEWLFYSELGTRTRFYYEPIVTTLTHDYLATGLNLRTRTLKEQLQLIPTIIKEAHGRGLYLSPAFWIYVKMRIIRAFVK